MKKLRLILSSLLLLPALWLVSSASAVAGEPAPAEEIEENGAGMALERLTVELGQVRIFGGFGRFESEQTFISDWGLQKGPTRMNVNGFNLEMDSVNFNFEDGIIVLENVRGRGAELETENDEAMELEDNELNGLEEGGMDELQAQRMIIDTKTWTAYLVGPYRFQNQQGEEGDVLRLELRVEIETDPNVPEEELERLSPHLGMMDMDDMDMDDMDMDDMDDMDPVDDMDEGDAEETEGQ